MDLTPFISFLILLVLLAFFAGTEIPLMSVGAHKLESYLRQKRWGAKSLSDLRKSSERLLTTNLIATVIVTIAISSLSTLVALELAPHLGLPTEQAVPLVLFVASTIILVIGEILPKILWVRYMDTVALAVAPLYRVLVWAFTPINVMTEILMKGIALVIGGKGELHAHRVSEDELKAFIDMSHEHGAVEANERRQIKNLLDLSETRASQIMTARVHVTFARSTMSVDEVAAIMLRESYSRLPVSEESEDEVVYYVTIWDIFNAIKDGKEGALLKDLDLDKLPRITLAESMSRTLEIFQKSHLHMALVVDEHGGTAGIVTLEDVIEEVFGDIQDETDNEEEEIVYEDGQSVTALGRVSIEDVLDAIDIKAEDIDLSPDYSGKSLAYICLTEYGGLPRVGTSLWIWAGRKRITMTILSVHKKVIERVRVEKK